MFNDTIILNMATFKGLGFQSNLLKDTCASKLTYIISVFWQLPLVVYIKLNTNVLVLNVQNTIACMVRNDKGDLTTTFVKYVGYLSINVAEIWAIKDALGWANQHSLH